MPIVVKSFPKRARRGERTSVEHGVKHGVNALDIFHEKRSAEAERGLEVLEEGWGKEGRLGDLAIRKVRHEEVRSLTARIDDERIAVIGAQDARILLSDLVRSELVRAPRESLIRGAQVLDNGEVLCEGKTEVLQIR